MSSLSVVLCQLKTVQSKVMATATNSVSNVGIFCDNFYLMLSDDI